MTLKKAGQVIHYNILKKKNHTYPSDPKRLRHLKKWKPHRYPLIPPQIPPQIPTDTPKEAQRRTEKKKYIPKEPQEPSMIPLSRTDKNNPVSEFIQSKTHSIFPMTSTRAITGMLSFLPIETACLFFWNKNHPKSSYMIHVSIFV